MLASACSLSESEATQKGTDACSLSESEATQKGTDACSLSESEATRKGTDACSLSESEDTAGHWCQLRSAHQQEHTDVGWSPKYAKRSAALNSCFIQANEIQKATWVDNVEIAKLQIIPSDLS